MSDPRKRTSSFSSPSPTKLQRTSQNMASSSARGLRRTESLLSILPCDSADADADEQMYKTLQYHKDLRLKRQAAAAAAGHSPSSSSTSLYSPASLTLALTSKSKNKATKRLPISPIIINTTTTTSISTSAPNTNQRPTPPAPPQEKPHTQIYLPSARPLILTLRSSSPLAPHSSSSSSSLSSSITTTTPTQPIRIRTHPRSRPEPDLYRKAIKQRMGSSPEGRRLLSMGPRLAMSIMDATRELERIVAVGFGGGNSYLGGGGPFGSSYSTTSASASALWSEGDWDDGDVVMADSTSASASMGYAESLTSMVYPPLPAERSVSSVPLPPVLTNSWVLVRGEDLEMVDCAA